MSRALTASQIVPASMLAISLILSVAMAIAWRSFGHPRHALSWAIAYLVYAAEILFATLSVLVPVLDPIAGPICNLCILVAAMFVTIGARQRAGLPPWTRPLTLVVALFWMVIYLIDALPYDTSFLGSAGSLFTACVLPIAIRAIWPRDRRPSAAEWAAIATLSLFALYEVALVVAGGAVYFDRTNGTLHDLYRGIYFIGLTPVFVANGIAAVLLLASDLAAQLRSLASKDPLTGVLNRRGFQEAATRAVANGRRYRQPIAIAFADIDHFKSINDRYGHTAGDRTLTYVCNSLSQGLRLGDLVGRIGGEEFALLLMNSTAEQAAEAMERIRVEIAAERYEEGTPVQVTASFGVTSVRLLAGNPDQLLEEAMDRADRALYRSKVDGRNRITTEG